MSSVLIRTLAERKLPASIALHRIAVTLAACTSVCMHMIFIKTATIVGNVPPKIQGLLKIPTHAFGK